MKLKHLAGIVLATFLAGVAVAQTIATFNLSGGEVLLGQLGPGGGSIYIPSYVLRSGENHTLVATGTTVNTTVPADAGIVLATGAITTWTVTLPTAPYTGQRVIINCPGGAVSTLTVTATSPSGVALVGANPTSCSGGGAIASGVSWTYSTTAKTWYRYQ
jgi:hypothetical protein